MPTQCSLELSDHKNDRPTTHASPHTTLRVAILSPMTRLSGNLTTARRVARLIASSAFRAELFSGDVRVAHGRGTGSEVCPVEVQIIDCDGDSAADAEDSSSSIGKELNGSTSSYGGPSASVTDRYRRRYDASSTSVKVDFDVCIVIHALRGMRAFHRLFRTVPETTTSGGKCTSTIGERQPADLTHNDNTAAYNSTAFASTSTCSTHFPPFLTVPAGRVIVIFGGTDVNESTRQPRSLSEMTKLLTQAPTIAFPSYCGVSVDTVAIDDGTLSSSISFVSAFVCFSDEMKSDAIRLFPSRVVTETNAFVIPQSLDSEFSNHSRTHIKKHRDDGKLGEDFVAAVGTAEAKRQEKDGETGDEKNTATNAVIKEEHSASSVHHDKNGDNSGLFINTSNSVDSVDIGDKSSSSGGDDPFGFILQSLISGDHQGTCCRPFCRDGRDGAYNKQRDSTKGRDDTTTIKKGSYTKNGDDKNVVSNCDSDASLCVCCSHNHHHHSNNSHYSFVHMGGVRKVKGQRFALDAWRRSLKSRIVSSLAGAAQSHHEQHIHYSDQNDSVRGEGGGGGYRKHASKRCCCCCRTPRSTFWLWLVGPLLEPSYWEDEVKPFVDCVVEVVDDNAYEEEEEGENSHDADITNNNSTDAPSSAANSPPLSSCPPHTHERGEHNYRMNGGTMLGGLRVTSVEWLRPPLRRHGEGQAAYSSNIDKTPSQESVGCQCGRETSDSDSNNMLSHVVWLKGLPRRFVPLVFGSNADSTFVVASPSPPSTTFSPFISSPSSLVKPAFGLGSHNVQHSHRVLALLNTSDSEGQPQAALECMAMGRIPVILRNVAGNRCVVRDDYSWKRATESDVNSPVNIHDGEVASEMVGEGVNDNEIGNNGSNPTGFLVDTPSELAELIELFSESVVNGDESRECSERDDPYFDEKEEERKMGVSKTERSNERKLLPAICCDLPRQHEQRGRREKFQVGCRVKHAEEYVTVYHSTDSERSAYARLLRYVLFPPKV